MLMLLKDFVNPLYILAINKIASFLNVLGVFFPVKTLSMILFLILQENQAAPTESSRFRLLVTAASFQRGIGQNKAMRNPLSMAHSCESLACVNQWTNKFTFFPGL